MKKKLLALTLSLILIIGCFAACGKEKATDGNVTDGNATNGDVAEVTTKEETTTAENKEDETTKADEEETTEAAVTSTSVQIVTLPADENGPSPFFDAFTTKTIDGKDVTEEIFKGNKLTMVNVWGTFCDPCIYEMPFIEQLSKDYADKGLKVVGIVEDTFDFFKKENNADKLKKAEDIVAQTGVTYPILLPSESLNSVRLNFINTFPTTYFLNENGEIITAEYVGSRSYEQWAAIVDSILAVL